MNDLSINLGMSGLFDFGPLGCAIQNNLIEDWKRHFILHDKMHQIDCSILTPEIVLKASGHLAKFADAMVCDTVTNTTYRVDHLLKYELENLINKSDENERSLEELKRTLKKIKNSEIESTEEIDEIISKNNIKSPNGNSLSNSSLFNLMFKSHIGAYSHNKWYKLHNMLNNYI